MSKKLQKTEEKPGKSKPSTSSTVKESDELTRLAVEEILKETKMAKIRGDQFGAVEWRKCPLNKTNKRFLNNTLKTVVNHNKRENDRIATKSIGKLKELDRVDKLRKSKKKFGERKHEYRKPEKKVSDDER